MKTFSKIGAIALLSVTALMAPVFQGCKQETFDINTNLPNGSQSINIPGVDLSTIESLLTEMKNLINANQEAQLEALVTAIAGEDTALQGKLADVVEAIKANTAADAAQYEAIMAELGKIFQAITALQDNVCQKLAALATAINDNATTSTTAIKAAIEAAQNAIKTANLENQKDLIIALSSEFVTLSSNFRSAIEKLDSDLVAKLDDILAKANDIYDNGQVSEKDLSNIAEDMSDLLEEMKALLEKVDNLNKALCEKIDNAVAAIKANDGTNTKAITDAIAAAQSALIQANATQIASLVSAISTGDNDIIAKITEAVNSLNNGALNDKLTALNTLLASVQADIQANGKTSDENLDAVKNQLDDILNEITNVITAVNQLSKDLQTKIEAAAQSIITNDNSNIADVITAVVDAKTAVETASSNVILQMVTSTNDIISDITSAVNALNDGALSQKLSELVTLASQIHGDGTATIEQIHALQNQFTELLNDMYNILQKMEESKDAILSKMSEVITSISKAANDIVKDADKNAASVIESITKAETLLEASLEEEVATLTDTLTKLLTKLNDTTVDSIEAAAKAINENTNNRFAALYLQIDTLKMTLDEIENNGEITNEKLQIVKKQLKTVISNLKQAVEYLQQIKKVEKDIIDKIAWAAEEVNKNITFNAGEICDTIQAARTNIVAATMDEVKTLIDTMKAGDNAIIGTLNALISKVSDNNDTLKIELGKIEDFLAAIKNSEDLTTDELAGFQQNLAKLLKELAEALVETDTTSCGVVANSTISFVNPPVMPKANATLTTSSNVTWGWDSDALFAFNRVALPAAGSYVYPLSEIQALYDAVENNLKSVSANTKAEESSDKTAEIVKAKAALNEFIGTLNVQWSTIDTLHTYSLRTNLPENVAVNEVVLWYETEVKYVPVVVYANIGSTKYYVTGYKAEFVELVTDPTYTINYTEDTSGHGTSHHGSSSHGTSTHGYTGHGYTGHSELTHSGWTASNSQVGGGFTTK